MFKCGLITCLMSKQGRQADVGSSAQDDAGKLEQSQTLSGDSSSKKAGPPPGFEALNGAAATNGRPKKVSLCLHGCFSCRFVFLSCNGLLAGCCMLNDGFKGSMTECCVDVTRGLLPALSLLKAPPLLALALLSSPLGRSPPQLLQPESTSPQLQLKSNPPVPGTLRQACPAWTASGAALRSSRRPHPRRSPCCRRLIARARVSSSRRAAKTARPPLLAVALSIIPRQRTGGLHQWLSGCMETAPTAAAGRRIQRAWRSCVSCRAGPTALRTSTALAMVTSPICLPRTSANLTSPCSRASGRTRRCLRQIRARPSRRLQLQLPRPRPRPARQPLLSSSSCACSSNRMASTQAPMVSLCHLRSLGQMCRRWRPAG